MIETAEEATWMLKILKRYITKHQPSAVCDEMIENIRQYILNQQTDRPLEAEHIVSHLKQPEPIRASIPSSLPIKSDGKLKR